MPSISKSSDKNKVCKQRKVDIGFSQRVTDNKKRQHLIISEDGETSYETSTVVPVNKKIESRLVQLGEFIGDCEFRSSDVSINIEESGEIHVQLLMKEK